MKMCDMTMPKTEGKAMVAETSPSVGEKYPSVYLRLTPELLKAVKGLAPGDGVTLVVKGDVERLSLSEPTEYDGSVGEICINVVQAGLESANEFAELSEDD